MIKPKCVKCKKVLKSFGAIVLSPPGIFPAPDGDLVVKYHICRKCWEDLELYIHGN